MRLFVSSSKNSAVTFRVEGSISINWLMPTSMLTLSSDREAVLLKGQCFFKKEQETEYINGNNCTLFLFKVS